MMTGESLWSLISSAANEPEVEEIAFLIGNKRIKENANLWLEVKAYNDILSEMHSLELSDQSPLEEVHTGNNLLYSASVGSLSNQQRTKNSSLIASDHGIPKLNLRRQQQSSDSNPTSSAVKSNDQKHKSVDFSMKKNTGSTGTQIKDGSSITRTSFVSNGKSVGGQKQKSQNVDPVEFILQIKEYLTPDKISIVLDRIRSAMDDEKIELTRKVKQLEATMEGDCEVIVTSRSSNKSNISTPRHINGLSGQNPTHNFSNNSNNSGMMEGVNGQKASASAGVSTDMYDNYHQSNECDICQAYCSPSKPDTAESKRGSTDHSSTSNRSLGSSSSGSGSGDGGIYGLGQGHDYFGTRGEEKQQMCSDCKARSRREKILGSKLPKMEYSTTVSSRSGSNKSNQHFLDNENPPHLSSLDRDKDRDREIDKDRDKTYGDHLSATVSGTNNVPSSKFRNRLQAARDEHHFIADDYSKR